MRYGVAIAQSEHPRPADAVLAALDAWARSTGRMPDVFPLWSRLRDGLWELDSVLLTGLRARGVEPTVYVESRGDYAAILAGTRDDALRLLACRAGDTVVRWDQEVDRDWGAPWHNPAARDLYVETFQHVSSIMRAEAPVRMFYCPGGADIALYYPGDEATQVLGFDRYTWKATAKPPPEQWAGSIAECQAVAPGKEIRVGECGILASLRHRGAWLRAVSTVPSVAVAVVFDMLVPVFLHDWRWDARMRTVFKGLP